MSDKSLSGMLQGFLELLVVVMILAMVAFLVKRCASSILDVESLVEDQIVEVEPRLGDARNTREEPEAGRH